MGRYLTETIESVLRNLRPGDEYYVIDGGSQDDSIAVMSAYEKRLTGWVSEADKGYADAIRKGFSRGKSEFQCWINSGDLLLDGALDCARRHLVDAQADFIYGDDYCIDDSGAVLFRSHGGFQSLKHMMLYGGYTPLQDACYWRRSIYDKVGGINPELKLAADYELFLKFALRGRCAYVPGVFSAFRRHAGQQSHSRARSYREEKYAAASRFSKSAGYGVAKKTILRAAYRVWGPLRARVFQRFWNSRAHSGMPVTELRAECPA